MALKQTALKPKETKTFEKTPENPNLLKLYVNLTKSKKGLSLKVDSKFLELLQTKITQDGEKVMLFASVSAMGNLLKGEKEFVRFSEFEDVIDAN